MRLVDDWKQAYSWYSIHAAVILGALSAAQTFLPQMQALISPTSFSQITATLSLLIVVGRLIAQGEEAPK